IGKVPLKIPPSLLFIHPHICPSVNPHKFQLIENSIPIN
ncbi:unnamed protein product, partial [marine sediment metagenome]